MKRALIVAIERYSEIQGALAPTLEGTHQNAEAFRRWLIEEHGLKDEDIFLCTEDPKVPGRTAGATKAEIERELIRLKDAGKDQTEELFCFLTGHGLCYTDAAGIPTTDIFVCSDFVDNDSGGACIRINELQAWLRRCLGPEHHYYFIDCCRTKVSEADLRVGALSPRFDVSNLGHPTVYTLYSTAEGRVAMVDSGFATALVDALRGVGRAKVWRGNSMAVLFDSVGEYVRTQLPSIDERKEGSGEGLIVEITPPPKYTCTIEIDGAEAGERFELTVTDTRARAVINRQFDGPRESFAEVPDDYTIEISPDVVAVDPLPADLYEDATVRFKKEPAPPPIPASRGAITVASPSIARIQISPIGMRNFEEFSEDLHTVRLPRGRYAIDMLDDRDVRVASRHVEIEPGRDENVDLTVLASSPLRDALLDLTGNDPTAETVELSETIGPMIDQGLDLWLALVGASRIIEQGGYEFDRLRHLPLSGFQEMPPGRSGILLLAGLEDPDLEFGAAVSEAGGRRLERSHLRTEVPGLYELRVNSAEPGSMLLTFQVGPDSPVTMPVCSLAGRVTLVTITLDEHRAAQVGQFMLPHVSMVSKGPEFWFPSMPSRTLRTLVEVQRQFAHSRDFARQLRDGELIQLLYGKWFEPIGAMLSAYELARRGPEYKSELQGALDNLRTYFKQMPDTEAVAVLAGEASHDVDSPPLVLDGLLALDLRDEDLPMPRELLDFRGPWTAWRGRP